MPIYFMLAPKRTQYRKYQKGTMKNVAHNLNVLQFGQYGLKSCRSGALSAKTIEAVRRCIRRDLKRVGFLWIRCFPDIPVTRKPAEVRMGKGKGNVSFWTCKIRPGQILYEMNLHRKSICYVLEKIFFDFLNFSQNMSNSLQIVQYDTVR